MWADALTGTQAGPEDRVLARLRRLLPPLTDALGPAAPPFDAANVWMGSGGSVSWTHFDMSHNVYVAFPMYSLSVFNHNGGGLLTHPF